ncbi:MAG: 3-deoxy-7-phosphoheptulonate synthase class II [Thermoleophilia bacterium]
MAVVDSTWSPSSWRAYPTQHQPAWPDPAALEDARSRLRAMPPLVFAGECRKLRASLAEVAAGRAFLLQAGDCAESFHDFTAGRGAVTIREKLRIMLQMSVALTYGATLPVVKVGRIAGQFAKPRSSPVELVGGVELPSFFGHMVNDDAPTDAARRPDPARMVEGYTWSAAALNLLRAFTKGGFADITRVHEWNQAFVSSSTEGQRYERLASDIERALRFMAACGIDLASEPQLHEVDVWTSHEGLLLDYEEGLTRRDSLTGDWYDCSAHMLWIGERTRQPDGAHAAFFAGVHNPLGVKLGPTSTPDDAVALCERLNPDRIPGRLTFIVRMGHDRVRELLPPLLRAVAEAGHPVVWATDPMHGNMIKTSSGIKTRTFDAILGEIEGFFHACWAEGAWPGGVHLEYTGEDVTECLGGPSGAVLEDQLSHRYETLCDPRLNARQSLDLAFRVAELMQQRDVFPAAR